MATHSLKLGTYLVESLVLKPPSSETASLLLLSFSLNGHSSSFPHSCIGFTMAPTADSLLSHAVLSYERLKTSYCCPRSPFPNQHLHLEREFQLHHQTQKAKGEGCRERRQTPYSHPSPLTHASAPGSPSSCPGLAVR